MLNCCPKPSKKKHSKHGSENGKPKSGPLEWLGTAEATVASPQASISAQPTKPHPQLVQFNKTTKRSKYLGKPSQDAV
jgi:hypothetical protein